MTHEGLGLADLPRQLFVASRLPRLPFQALDLRIELAQDVAHARQIALGGAQAQLGLMPAAVQPRDPGRVFQNAPPLIGLGVDDLADLSLTHQRRRAGAGGGVFKQDPDVTRPHVLAVDAIGRAGLALDAAGDFQRVLAIEFRGRAAIAVVDEDGDLGHVARRPIVGAIENHVVHGGRAHAFVGGLAHHPAQGLQQVRLAATVGSDDAGEPCRDHDLGWLHERLETEKPQPIDMHETGNPSGSKITRAQLWRRHCCGSHLSYALLVRWWGLREPPTVSPLP